MMDLAERMVALVRPDLEAGLGNPNEVAWLRRVIGYLRFYQRATRTRSRSSGLALKHPKRGFMMDLAERMVALVRPDLEAGLGNPNEVAWLRRVIERV